MQDIHAMNTLLKRKSTDRKLGDFDLLNNGMTIVVNWLHGLCIIVAHGVYTPSWCVLLQVTRFTGYTGL